MIQTDQEPSNLVFLGFDFGKLVNKLQGWLDGFMLKLPNIAVAIVVLFVFWIIAKYVSRFVRNVLMRHVHQDSIKVVAGKISFAITVLIGFFLALGILDLDRVLTTILAGAGVISLAVGLALQGTLGNTFSGVILAFLPRIQLGDWIETNGFAGFVEDISLRSVIIKEADNNYVIIPNSKIVDSPFKNYSQTRRSRVFVSGRVGYESNLEQVEELTKKALATQFTLDSGENVEFYYQEFGDISINFLVRFWIDASKKKDILTAQNTAIKVIKNTFDSNGIKIPFPIRTLDFGKNKLRAEAISITDNQNREDEGSDAG